MFYLMCNHFIIVILSPIISYINVLYYFLIFMINVWYNGFTKPIYIIYLKYSNNFIYPLDINIYIYIYIYIIGNLYINVYINEHKTL